MEWHQYLRQERAQKISGLMRFLAGDLSIAETLEGGPVDATDAAIERLKRNIADIESILTAAGVPLEEDEIVIVQQA